MTNENLAPVLISGVSCYERDGTAYLRLEDVARGLGFTTVATSGNEIVRWARVRKLNALDIIADSKDKKLMSAFINATKKLAAAHSVRMDRLNELPAVEEQPEQTAFERGA